MIKKIKNISFGIFKNFDWDKNLGKNTTFEKINIIYGRNYSGKTTLSRMVRALETKSISEKYANPLFKIEFEDNGSSITQENYTSNNQLVRVFNEDFVRENLSFPYNDDGDIKSFALLGKENVGLQTEINNIMAELGNNEENNKTGLYKEKEAKQKVYNDSKNDYDLANKNLQDELTKGARKIGDSSRNYNKNNLQQDINVVLRDDFTSIDDNQKETLNTLIKENSKQTINPILNQITNFTELSNQVKKIVEQKVGDSSKIEELVRNAELNRWVKEGKSIQKGRKICAFCGNPISDERWKALDKHFDEEYEKLEKSIIEKQTHIESEKIRVEKYFEIEKDKFYSSFGDKLKELEKIAYSLKIKTNAYFVSLKSQLEKKHEAMLENLEFITPEDFSNNFFSFISSYNKIVEENNDYTSQLSTKQNEAKKQLRLQSVYEFCNTVQYKKQIQDIDDLDKKRKETENEFTEIQDSILEKEKKIKELNSQMSNEKEGARKINEYLSIFFDANHLSLDITTEEDIENEKQTHFSILRDGEKAFNLSEGECHIIAFCYFMAKLNEIKDLKPIIWIDDPICSLDDNHICSVYSLVHAELRKKEKYEQLFISTHNLDFFKYIKGLIYNESKSQFLIIERDEKSALIKKMPVHMKIYATEFNYLFKQIYDCAHALNSVPTDKDLNMFYNFGNNVRKFLEIFLYYEYPDMFGLNKDEQAMMERRKEFFGDDFEAIFTRHYSNNYSHGNIERATYPFNDEECKKLAKIILNKIKDKNIKQYESLCKSIDVSY